ncbi:MAG: sulfotransferase [Pseudomonadota bacterium]
MSLPDFLIIGAMKSGTTTLQAQLAAQPGLFMTNPKEPNFFSDDPIYARGLDWYGALYADAASGDLKGEASTHYTKLPTYPATATRLAEAVEAPRLIYMIRNPVARAVSHYIHEWTQGLMSADSDAAFAQHPELEAYSRYGMQIAPYIDRFGAEAVHLTSLEQIQTDPEGELQKIGTHIGAPAPLVWDHGIGAQNVSAERVRRLPMHKLLVGNPVAAALRRTLIPKSIRTRIREGRKPSTRPELSDRLKQRLETDFLQDRAALAGYFPDHPALTACYPFAAS